MALQTSGVISLYDVRQEIGGSGEIFLADSRIRAITGVTSGVISLQDCYGKSRYKTTSRGTAKPTSRSTGYNTTRNTNFSGTRTTSWTTNYGSIGGSQTTSRSTSYSGSRSTSYGTSRSTGFNTTKTTSWNTNKWS